MSFDGGQTFYTNQGLVPDGKTAGQEARVHGTDLNKDEAELIFIRFIKESQVNNNYIYRE